MLLQEIKAYAASARDRYLMEARTGQVNTTRMNNHRRALLQITKSKKDHSEMMAKHTDAAARKPLLVDSTFKLVAAELLYYGVNIAVLTIGDATYKKGVALFALFWVWTVLIYMDAGWTLTDAMYWTTEIPTTIGWGDLDPLGHGGLEDTEPLKKWTVLHILASGMLIGPGLQQLWDTQIFDGIDEFMDGGDCDQCQGSKVYALTGCMLLFFTFSFGTFFYNWLEPCTCSYGPSRVDGCVERPLQTCIDTGGYRMTLLDSIYMMVVSASSVGYGDKSPKSYMGRWFAIPFFLTTVGINNHAQSKVFDLLSNFFGSDSDANWFHR